jgi:hypothetical protein
MRHKHADVLNAIADGKDVQYRESWQDYWTDADLIHLENIKDPFTFPSLDWRIKPEPKPDVVKNLHFDNGEGECKFYMTSKIHLAHPHWHNHLQLTFCGETGKLKSAEVLICD